MEYFEITSKDAVVRNNKKTIVENDDFNCNGYGSQLIVCKNNTNIYKWNIRIDSMNDSLYIGIDDGNAYHTDKYDCFAHKRTTNNYSYSYDGYIQCLGKELIGGLASACIKVNDVLNIELNISNKTLAFCLNNKLIHVINDIIVNNDQTYRLAVYVSMACVTIIDFNIKENNNVEFKQKQNEVKTEDVNNNSGLMSEDLLDMFLQYDVEQKINEMELKTDDINTSIEENEEKETLLKEVDVSMYKDWNENDVIEWMLSIQNGIFLAFEDEVRNDIINMGIKGKDLIDLNKDVLKKFSFSSFVELDVLEQNIKQLTKQNLNESKDD
eukprot:152_1